VLALSMFVCLLVLYDKPYVRKINNDRKKKLQYMVCHEGMPRLTIASDDSDSKLYLPATHFGKQSNAK
jgi:hypothetical protein